MPSETEIDAGNDSHVLEAGTQDNESSTQISEDESQLEDSLPQTSGSILPTTPCNRKRKDMASPDPLAQSLQSYFASCNNAKQQRLEKNLDKWSIWAKNLTENIKKLSSERRRLLLQIEVDELVTKAMREDLLAQTE